LWGVHSVTSKSGSFAGKNLFQRERLILRRLSRRAKVLEGLTIKMKAFGLSALIALAAIGGCYAQDVGRASYYRYSRSTGLVAAHRTLPIDARVKVTNLKNGRNATVVIVGRGPFVPGRIIDGSTNVADILDFRQAGEAIVLIEVVRE
jgi:peptidoglycan lytic transglycosylase